jgi:MFS superfamily sulfate permease-like transporter
MGLLKLGFLLEFISLPVLSGFITAIAITIILNQMDSLLGEDNVGDGAATQIHDIFGQLPNAVRQHIVSIPVPAVSEVTPTPTPRDITPAGS